MTEEIKFRVRTLRDMPPREGNKRGRFADLIDRFRAEAQPGWGIFVDHPNGAAATTAELRAFCTLVRQAFDNAKVKVSIQKDSKEHGVWVFKKEHLPKEAAPMATLADRALEGSWARRNGARREEETTP